MTRLLAVLAALSLAAAAPAEPDPGVILVPGAPEGPWRQLTDALASKGAVEARFTERRFFPFRREPTVLKGVIRISPERGLSLQYTDPEANTVIVDETGLIIRDALGRERATPAGSREAGAISALLPIMRFDLATLAPRFEMRATTAGAGWRIDFNPRDPEAAHALGLISIEGSKNDVTRIVLSRSATQRIEIEVGDTRSGVTFTPAELAAYFRRSAPP